MSITYGPNLGLMSGALDGDIYGDAMRAFQRGLDGLVMPNVKGYLTNTPPATPSEGDLYIIGAAPTGLWAGNGGKVARWSSLTSAWEFYTPKNGWMLQANTAREAYRHTAGVWEIFYQEGTFTPALLGSVVAGTNTYSSQFGAYKRVGSMVFALARVTLTAKDPAMSGNISINGLPYQNIATIATASIFAYGFAVAPSYLQVVVGGNATTLTIYRDIAGALLNSSYIGDSTSISVTATYALS